MIRGIVSTDERAAFVRYGRAVVFGSHRLNHVAPVPHARFDTGDVLEEAVRQLGMEHELTPGWQERVFGAINEGEDRYRERVLGQPRIGGAS